MKKLNEIQSLILVLLVFLPTFCYYLKTIDCNTNHINYELVKSSQYGSGRIGYDGIVGAAAYYSSGSTIYWDFINLDNVDIEVLAMTGDQFGDAVMGDRPIQYHSLLMESDMGYGYFTVPSFGQWAIGFYHHDFSQGSTNIYFNVGSPSPYVRITRPSLAENWVKKNSIFRIEWTNYYVPNAKLELWKGASYLNDISPYLMRSGFYPTYDWAVPNSLAEGTDYRIKIVNRVNPNIYDFSDYFEIYENDLLECIQPTVSSVLGTDTNQEIQWNWRGDFSNMDIELWNETDFVSDIASSTEWDGSYSWSIPYNISEGFNYKIKLIDHDKPSFYNYSDSFAIIDASPPKINIQNPLNHSFTKHSVPSFSIAILEMNLDSVLYQLQNDSSSTGYIPWEGQIEQNIWSQFGNGTLQFILFANDTNGNSNNKSLILHKDIISPIILVDEPTSYTVWGTTAPQVSAIIMEANLYKKWYCLENSTFITRNYQWEGIINQSVWDLIRNGTLLFKLFANDTNGNEAFKEIFLLKDIIPPEWLSDPGDQYVEFGDILFLDLDVIEKSGISHWWINDTSQFNINFDGELTSPIDLLIGEYWLDIGVCDVADNYINASIKITVQDTTSPHWVVEPEDHVMDYGTDLYYSLYANDLSGISYWWINDSAKFNIDTNGKISNLMELEEGVYYIEVRAFDAFDNYCSKIIQITVERSPPPSGDIPGYNGMFVTIIVSVITSIIIIYKRRTMIRNH